jgi:hypothetical protein
MAYNFTAEKHGEQDLHALRERLSGLNLIEFFTVEVSAASLALGISIPYKAMDDPGFRDELEEVMNYLVSEQGFRVTDLFTGNAIAAGDIPDLAQHISA